MISEKHSEAARANGARSRGPVTPEGKAISSRNAMRHGLLAKTVLLSNEDPVVFETFFYLMIERFSPVDDVEMSMVEDMTAACWRLRRGMAMEKWILEAGIAVHPGRPSIEQITAAFCDSQNASDLERLVRYQVRLQNIYQRALRGLAQMRKMPRQNSTQVQPDSAVLPNEPRTLSICNTRADAPLPVRPEHHPAAPATPSPDADPTRVPVADPKSPLEIAVLSP